MEKLRVKWLDILKGISIIFVVIGHIYINDYAYKFLYSFHLPLFMFVSGCLFKEKDCKENFKKKFKTILVPYIFFAIIELIYFYVIEQRFRTAEQITIFQSVVGILFGYYPWLEFNVHLWYLPFFFFTIILYNFICKITNRNVARFVYIFLGIVWIFVKIPNLPFSMNRFYLLFYFAIGDIVYNESKMVSKLDDLKTSNILIISIISLIIVIIMNYYNLNEYGLNYIIGILGILSMVMVSKSIENKDKILTKIGEITLVILCIHGPIYRILIKLLSIILKTGTDIIRTKLYLVLIIVCLTLLLCYIVYKVLEKMCPVFIGRPYIQKNKYDKLV